MHGWMGTVLRVNLTAQSITREALDPAVAHTFIGGRGFNSRTLFRELKPAIDPLGPENIICMAPGPLSGTSLSSTSRLHVSTLSPYSYILGDGNVGGSFAALLKRAGYDQVIISGRAPHPQYLWIDDDQVELRDARELWGRNTWETCDALGETHGKHITVASIGQAGENMVRYASTIVDKHNSAARGSGAVLGSKQLKAVVVHGTQHVPLADELAFRQLAREDRDFLLHDDFQKNVAAVYGSHIGMGRWWPGLRYYEQYLAEDEIPPRLTPQALKAFEVGRTACLGCAVPCKDVFRIPDGVPDYARAYAGEIGKAMEHECLFGLGTNCGIVDPEPIMVMENLADKYGMCVIPLGNAVAFAKFLYNQGILTQEDTGGLDLAWEDAASQIELLHQVALRQGFGNIVAEGMHAMAQIIGRGAESYCYDVKGLSRGPHPAGVFGLAHATSTRGADHLRGRSWAFGENDPAIWPDLIAKGFIPVEDPVATLMLSERATTLTDMLGRCKGAVNNWASAAPLVAHYPLLDGAARVLTAATGVHYSEAQVAEAADRVYLLEMALNARQGITRVHDRLPLKPEFRDTLEGQAEEAKHQQMLDDYYTLRGCDHQSGVPTTAALTDLGLQEVAAELAAGLPYPNWQGPPLWPLDDYPHGGQRA